MAFKASSVVLCLALFCGYTFALEVADQEAAKQTTDLSEDEGSGKLYFTGPGYTINLIPQAILLGLLSFLAVYFLGLDLFGSSGGSAPASGYGAPATGYGAPASGYGAPEPAYAAPARYYDTYSQGSQDSLYANEDSRRKRSSF